MINYYTELSLDETKTTAELREKIEIQRYQWEQRAARAGSGAEKAKRKIELISEALRVFENDGTRDDYDIALLRTRSSHNPDNVEIDWLDRAWSYYFMSEYGPAEIAARNARSKNDQSPSPYVVSAWIEIAKHDAVSTDYLDVQAKSQRKQHLQNAQRFTDEALVLDEMAQDSTEVHHVRGVVLALLGETDKASRSFERALKTAIGADKAIIQWRMMRIQLGENHSYEACQTAASLLCSAEIVSPDQLRIFIEETKTAIRSYAFDIGRCDYLLKLFDQDSIPSAARNEVLGIIQSVRRGLEQRAASLKERKRIEEELTQLRQQRTDHTQDDFASSLAFLGGGGLLFLLPAAFIVAVIGEVLDLSNTSLDVLLIIYLIVCFGMLLTSAVMAIKGQADKKRTVELERNIRILEDELRRLDRRFRDIEANSGVIQSR